MAITTRRDKGSALTYDEMDDNFEAIAPRDSETGSVQIPTGTTSERTASPQAGMLRYNSSSNVFEGYQSGAWQTLAIGSGGEINQNAFSEIQVSGQATVQADQKTDVITFVAGTNMSITTAAGTDTITFAASAPSVAFSDLTSTPTTISGYGITDAFDGAYSSLSGIPTSFTPNTHTQPFSSLTSLPTTLAGYGITDAFDGDYNNLTNVPSTFTPSAHNQAWSTITGTPTTIAGYGITDSYTDSSVSTHLNVSSAANNEVLAYRVDIADFEWVSLGATFSTSDVDTHLNTGTATANQLLSWDGSDYDWIAAPATYGNADVDAHINVSTANTNQLLSWNGADYSWIDTPATYGDSDVDTHINTGTANTNQILRWTGTDYDWVDPESGGISFVVTPIAFATVRSTSANTTYTGMTAEALQYSAGNYARMNFTFATAQPDTNYTVVSDWEIVEDNNIIEIKNKANTGFTAEFYAQSTGSPLTAGGIEVSVPVLQVFGSTPTKSIIKGDELKVITTSAGANALSYNQANGTFIFTPTSGGGGSELNDLSSVVTWTNVPDAYITQSSVTQHQAAFQVTESQITDLQSYITGITGESLSDLSDVATPGVNDDQYVLYYNHPTTSFGWKQMATGNTGGGGSSNTNLSTSSLTDLGDVDSVSNIDNLKVLYYDDTAGVFRWGYPDLTVTTNSAGTAAVSYNRTSGTITYTPPDLSGYLTSETSHADVVVDGDFTSQGLMKRGASAGSYSIVIDNSTNWNTAYSWGDHSTQGYLTSETSHADVLVDGDFTSAGFMKTDGSGGYSVDTNTYLTSYTETDPVFSAHTTSNIINGTGFLKNNGSGTWTYDNSTYLTSETSHADVLVDGDFTSQGIMLRGANTGSYSILTDNSTNWDTAYGWGNHASAGYLTSETYTGTVTSVAQTVPTGFTITGSPITTSGTLAIAFDTGYSLPTTASQTNWDTAYGWGDHASAGYLTSYTETDPVFSAHTANNIVDGTGFLKNNGTGTWSYDNNTYLTSISVGVTVPTGFAVTGSPITSSGTLAIAFDTGYSLPTSASQTNWDTAYGWGDHSAAGYTSYANSDVDAHLNQSNPTSGYVLSWNGTDYAWVAQSGGGGLADVVDDTSPQLGGDLDVNAKDFTSSSGQFDFTTATSATTPIINLIPPASHFDTQIRLHTNNSGTYQDIMNDGGVLKIRTNDANPIEFIANGSTRITLPQAGGVTINADLNVNGKQINFGDSDGSTTNMATFGASDDLKIYHFGNTYIENINWDLTIRNSANDYDVKIQTDNGSGGIANYFVADGSTGAAEMHWGDYSTNSGADGGVKLKTTAGGVEITGKITGLTDPTSAQDAATKAYVDANAGISNLIEDTTPQLGGNLDANDKIISDVRGLNIEYNTNAGGSYPYLNFYQNDGSNTYQGNNQELGRITWRGLDSNDNSVSLASIKPVYESYTPSRDARMEFMVTDANVNRTVLTLNSSAATGVEVEDGENLTLTASTTGVEFPDSSGTRSLRFKKTASSYIALTPANPTSARTITVPDATGTMALTSDIPSNVSDLTNDSGFITDLVNDTSPQLGGGLSVNNQYIYFSDDDDARFGNAYDLKIYHDATANENKIIGSGTNGNISIESKNVFVSNTTIEGMYSVSSHMPAISSANGTVTHDITTGSVFYHSGMASDFTVNFTNVPTDNNRSLSVSLIMTQGATAYMPTAVQIAGTGQTISWAGGSVPTGTANKKDVVNFTLIRNSNSWQVIGIANSYKEPFSYTITTATADFNGPYHDLRPVTVSETSGDNTWYEQIEGFNFNSNGTILIARLDDGHFHRWDLSTGYDLTTATYANRSNLTALAAREGSTTFVKPDGTELYAHTGTLLAAHTMSTAWDVTTLARNTSKDLTTSSLGSGLYGIEFSSDGTKLYIANRSSTNLVFQLSLSTAWNPSTASLTPTYTLTSGTTEYFQGISFKSDGTSFHLFDGISDDLHKYSLSTAWDLSTASFDASQSMIELLHGGINGLRWNSDGSKAIIASQHNGGPGLYTIDVNTNYDAASSSSLNYTTYFSSGNGFTKLYDAAFAYGSIRELRFNNDGTKLFFHTSSTAGKLYEIDLTTGWDLSTAQTGTSTSSGTIISSQLTGFNSSFEGFFFNTDGTKVYIADIDSTSSSPRTYYLREFNLSTAFDISTLSYSTAYSWTDSFNGIIRSIDINPDGTKLVVLYNTYDIAYFDLTTGWDFSTLTNRSTLSDSANLGAVGANNVSIRFNHDGTKFYMVDVQNLIYEYELTTAYDISTLVNQGSFRSNATQDALGLPALENSSAGMSSIHFKPDGSKMFYASRYRIYSYSVPNGTSTSGYTATSVVSNQSISGGTSVNLNNIPDYEWIVVEIKGPASETGGGNVGAYLRIDTTNASYSSLDYTVTGLYSIGTPYEISGKYVWSAPVGDTIDDWIAFNPLKGKIVQANGYNNGSYETNYTNQITISSHAKAKSIQLYNPYSTNFNAGTVSVTVYTKNS